jgi:2-isopropylmalate synthase
VFSARKEGDIWNVPYLPIDPKDLGRTYEAVIRVNSQSGKGGISYLLESEFGLELPRRLQIEFSQVVQGVMDAEGKELTAHDLWTLFEKEYGLHDVAAPQHRLTEQRGAGDTTEVELSADLVFAGKPVQIQGRGTGPIDAFVDGLQQATGRSVRVMDYHEHAIGAGANAKAVAYLELRVDDGRTLFGVGIDANIVSASLKAIVSGLQRGTRAEDNVPAEPEAAAAR